MAYQVNLIKDRVVPRLLGLKRMIIVSSEFTVVALAAIVVVFLGMQKDNEISAAEDRLESTTRALKVQQAEAAKVQVSRNSKSAAQKVKDEMVALWRSPVNVAALYEGLIDLCNNRRGLVKDDVRVYEVHFMRGPDPQPVVNVLVTLADNREYRAFEEQLWPAVFGGTDAPTDLAIEAGIGAAIQFARKDNLREVFLRESEEAEPLRLRIADFYSKAENALASHLLLRLPVDAPDFWESQMPVAEEEAEEAGSSRTNS
jgi:hypothetical protein